MQESHYLSADKATQIHSVKWTSSSEPIAIVQIAHGVTEYIERYAPLAKYLTDRGIIVVGNDHLGHGDSIRRDNTSLTIGSKDTEQYLVDDFYTCYKKYQTRTSKSFIYSTRFFAWLICRSRCPRQISRHGQRGNYHGEPANNQHLCLALRKLWQKSEAKKAGLEPEVKFYPGRHDILHETVQQDIYKDIYDWIQKVVVKR